MHKGTQRIRQLASLPHLIGIEQLDHATVVGRGHVRHHRNEARRATRHPREVQAVITRVVLQARAVHALHTGLHVTRRILDAQDARMLGEDVQCRIRKRDARTTRNVIEHDGQVGRIRHGAHVRTQALLGRTIVVRGHDEQTIRSVLLGTLADTHRVRSVIRTRTTQDERAIPHRLTDGVRQVILLRLVSRRRLTRRAGQQDRVASLVDQLDRQALRGWQINLTGGGHRRDHGGCEGTEAAGRNVTHALHDTHAPVLRARPARTWTDSTAAFPRGMARAVGP